MFDSQENVKELVHKFIKAFYTDHNNDELVKYLDDSAVWVASTDSRTKKGGAEIIGMLKMAQAQGVVPICDVLGEELEVNYAAGGTYIVDARYSIRNKTAEPSSKGDPQRGTFVFCETDNGLKVTHIHVSMPYEGDSKNELFPAMDDNYTFVTLLESVKVKDEQINIILGSITGGLKGSLNDDKYTYFYVSDELCSMLGYTKDEFMKMSGGTVAGTIYPPDKQQAFQDAADCFAKGDSYASEYRILKKDGSLVWVLDTGRKVEYNDGSVRINSIIMDITSRRQADATIKKQRDFLQSIYDNMQSGLIQCIIDEYPMFLNANKAAFRIFGYDDSDFDLLMSKSLYSFIHPEFRSYVESKIGQMAETGKPVLYEHKSVKKDGGEIWISVAGAVIKNLDGLDIFQGIFNDITDKKKAQLEADKEKDRYRVAMQSNSDLIFEYVMADDILRLYSNIATDKGSEVIKSEITNYRNSLFEKDMIYPADREKVLDIICNGNFKASEVRIRYPHDEEGSYRWAFFQGSIIREDGKPAYCVGTVRDIAKYKKAEEENEMLQRQFGVAIRSAYDEVYEVNLSSDEIYFLHTSGGSFQRTEIEGGFKKKFTAIRNDRIHSDDKDRYTASYDPDHWLKIDVVIPEEIYSEFRRVGEDGKYHWYSYMTRKASWDDYTIFIFIKNIDQAKAEEELHRQVLMDALSAAERANNAKSDFLSRMSHDIRTPMNAIIGMTTIALASSENGERIVDCLNKIGVSAKFLLSLINDILDMSRIESGKMVIAKDEFSLINFVRDISTMMYPQAEGRGINFDIIVEDPIDEYYIGDTLRLNQIVMNLLSNALKFTEKGGRIVLRLKQTSRFVSTANIRCIVSDTGIGMDEKFLKRVFMPFEQERSDFASNTTGTGLGLSITKNLVHLMNGSIDVKSSRGKGTTFAVDVQLGISNRSAVRLSTDHSFEGFKVLVIDDDVYSCEHTSALLKKIGAEADWVTSGTKALAKLKSKVDSKKYDAIIIDYKMPDMNGIEVAKAIIDSGNGDSAAIIIAAYDWAEIEAEARSAGVNLFITKPIFYSSMYNIIAKVSGKELENVEKLTKDFTFNGERILLVEDNEINMEIAKTLLDFKGLKSDTASNGEEAVGMFLAADEGTYNAILMDIRMPVKDGLEATRDIRSLERPDAVSTPIIAMTANAFLEDIEKAKKCGMNGYIVKPIDTQKLYETLHRAFYGGKSMTL